MKLSCIILLLAGIALRLQGQQVPQFSLYALNPYGLNPAYAGLDNTLVLSGVYRQQWSGLLGAPATQQVNAHLPVYAISSGLGLRIENDVIGAHNTTQAVLSYSYHLDLSRNTLLSAGFSGGWLQYSLDGAKLRAPEGTYAEPSFSHNETVLPQGRVQAGSPILEAGLILQNKKWELGLSAQPVFATRLKERSNGNFALKPVQHFMIYGMYRWQTGENLTLKPSCLVKTDFRETQMEVSVTGIWRENTFAGVSYRGFTAGSRDAAVLFLGFKMNEKTTLGYGFDLPLSALSTAHRGSHELLIRYSLNKPIGMGKLPPVIYNPRFF